MGAPETQNQPRQQTPPPQQPVQPPPAPAQQPPVTTTTTTTSTVNNQQGTHFPPPTQQQQTYTSAKAQLITLLNTLEHYKDRGRLQYDAEQALTEKQKWNLLPNVVKWGEAMWFRLEGELLTPKLRSPVHLWLPAEYPAGYPLLFVVPSKHSRLTLNHPHVGTDGRVYMEAISLWNPQTSNIGGLLLACYNTFCERPPLEDTTIEDSATVIQKQITKGLKGAFALAGKLANDTKQYYQQQQQQKRQNANNPTNQPQPHGGNPNQHEAMNTDENDPKKFEDVVATEPGTECAVCFENRKAAFCVPCGHIATCMTCSKQVKECCICRAPIKSVHKAYL